MHEQICFSSAVELSRRVRGGALSPVEIVEAHLSRIDEYDDQVNAFRTVFADRARERADDLEAALERGERLGPLGGVPVAIKDNTDVAGETTAAGLKPLVERGESAPRDDVVIRRLRDAGAILIGKTHMPELGMGTTDMSWDDPTSTPFDVAHNAGGSSGGSAAAVAAGMASVGLGTDGGGSIRIPASCCGVYGLKPTFRRVPMASTQATNAFTFLKPFSEYGPLARTVEDAAVMIQTISGAHSEDLFAFPDDGTVYRDGIYQATTGLDVAYSPQFDVFPVAPRVESIIDRAIEALRPAVGSLEETEIGFDRSHRDLRETWMDWIHVFRAVDVELLRQEGIDLHGTHADDVHPWLRSSADRGSEIGAVEYTLTDVTRTAVAETFRSAFEEYDIIITPTLAVPPTENSDEGYTVGPSEVNGVPVNEHIGWCLTYPVNFSGHPAASVPAGFTDTGLPVGLQIIGSRFAENDVIAISAALERLNGWADRYPPL